MISIKFESKHKLPGDVYSLSFIPEFPVSFSPGQSIQIFINDYEHQLYSIAPGSSTLNIRIVTKLTGSSTFKLALSRLKSGDTLRMKIDDNLSPFSIDANNVLFLAQGLAITPFISFLDQKTLIKPPISTIIHVSSGDHLFKTDAMKHADKSFFPASKNNFIKLLKSNIDEEDFDIINIAGSQDFVIETVCYLISQGIKFSRLKFEPDYLTLSDIN
jgi:ferredoxin-NADP reductase